MNSDTCVQKLLTLCFDHTDINQKDDDRQINDSNTKAHWKEEHSLRRQHEVLSFFFVFYAVPGTIFGVRVIVQSTSVLTEI